jgi:hypothetical protein
MTFSDPQASSGASLREASAGELTDGVSRIASVLERAVRYASELRRFAEDARGSDDELSAFFEHCADTQTEQATKARQLLILRTISHCREAVTSAAFAAGDGATDADVAPSSERRSVRVWPAQ